MSAGAIVSILFGGLALAAAFVYRRRLRTFLGRNDQPLGDEQIRRIEERGRLEVDDPLDMDGIRDEEERFWNESAWDQPEEW